MAQSIGQKFTPITLIKFALPSMIMMVFMSCYTIIDGIFISRFLGDTALSAVNIVYPVINILIAIGVMLATGGSAVVAKKLGEGNRPGACSDFSMLVAVGVSASVVLIVVTFLFLESLCRMLGSDDVLLAPCKAYLGTLILFSPACMLQCLFQSFFVTAGKPQIGLVLTVTGGIANAVLDYVFLAPLHFGVEGAAIATGIGQMIPAVFGIFFFFFYRKDLYFTRFGFHFKTFLQACANGSSEMVTNLSHGLATYLFNLTMMRLVGASGVAAITIILYAEFLFNSLYMGFSMGVAPVFSFHYGAKNELQLQNIFKISRNFTLLSSLFVTVISFVSADFIVRIFVGGATGTYTLAKSGFALFSFSFLFSGLNIYASSLFTALSDGRVSAIISFSRTFVFLVLSILLLPLFLGINGVWLAVPVAEFMTVFVSTYFLVKNKKRYHYA